MSEEVLNAPRRYYGWDTLPNGEILVELTLDERGVWHITGVVWMT